MMNVFNPLKTIQSALKLLNMKEQFKGSQIVLLDTPRHNNIGDLAIALAERKFIKEQLYLPYCEISAPLLDHNEKLLSSLIFPNQTILVHGGGFLGTLWLNEEMRFRRILTAFRDHRIVVLPQTVTFSTSDKKGEAILRKSQYIYQAHPNLTICVRETQSLDLMGRLFPKVNVELIPDIVTSLQIDSPSPEDRNGILLCMRHDHEKAISESDYTSLLSFLRSMFGSVCVTDTIASTDPCSVEAGDRLVIEKLTEFKNARLVITDRLHGMVFAAITGTPCVALNNANKKVENVYRWLENLEYVNFSENNLPCIQDAIQNIDLSKEYTYNNDTLKPYFNKLAQIILDGPHSS